MVTRSEFLLAALAVAFVSCSTTPGESEGERRQELARTQDVYRPQGGLPALPKLTPESSADEIATYAALRSPRVEEAFHAWARAVHEITVARSLPDPSLSFEVEIGRMLEAVRPGASGAYPGPGKLALAAEAQSNAAAARRHEFEQAAVEAALRGRVAWLRAAWLAETIDVRRQVLDLVREIEDLASAQFRVGRVSQQDVLRAQIERDEMETEITSLDDSRNLVAAELRSALGVPPSEPAPPMPARPTVTTTEVNLADDLLGRALQGNHRLLALREEIREAESMIGLARKTAEPDYMLGLRIDLLSPIVVMPEVGATLPVYRDKIAATVSAALSARYGADSRLAGGVLDLVVQVADAHFRLRDARRRLELVGTKLLPKARAALDAARSAYPTGLTDMTGLLDAERSLLEFRIEEATSRFELESATAELLFVAIGTAVLPRP